MEAHDEMILALDRVLIPAAGTPEQLESGGHEAQLHISVVFTSVKCTLAALRKAGALATGLGARVTIVVTQIVPFPLPLTSPPVLLDFSERRFRSIASESPVETMVRLYLCRDQWETLSAVLRARSLVVIGGRKRRWPTREKRLAGKLRRAGHNVVFAEAE